MLFPPLLYQYFQFLMFQKPLQRSIWPFHQHIIKNKSRTTINFKGFKFTWHVHQIVSILLKQCEFTMSGILLPSAVLLDMSSIKYLGIFHMAKTVDQGENPVLACVKCLTDCVAYS